MSGVIWLLKSFGIDLTPDGIKEMFSKIRAEDLRNLVSETGLNPDDVIALPKTIADKLQQFEQRQIETLRLTEGLAKICNDLLMELSNVGNPRYAINNTNGSTAPGAITDSRSNRGGSHDPSGGGGNANGGSDGGSDTAAI